MELGWGGDGSAESSNLFRCVCPGERALLHFLIILLHEAEGFSSGPDPGCPTLVTGSANQRSQRAQGKSREKLRTL